MLPLDLQDHVMHQKLPMPELQRANTIDYHIGH
jgi:hypothetical protein